MENVKKRIQIGKTQLLFCFLLFLIAMSYSNTLYSPFVLDDLSAFVNPRNLYLQDFSFESLAKLAKTRFGIARVIPIATFALNHYISQGTSIVIYHLTNILIHLLTTIAIAFLLKGLLKTRPGQNALQFFRPEYFILGVCGFWALSPVQTNGVTYLVQRMTSMATLFYIAACSFYVYARLAKANLQRAILYVFCLLSAICAFLSKENAATLPAAVLMIEFMFMNPDLGLRLFKATRWYHLLILLVILILIFPVIESFVARQMSGFSSRHFTVYERLLTQMRIVIFYISLLLLPLPSRMNIEHDFPLSSSLFLPPETFFSLLLIIGTLAGAFYFRKRYVFVSFGIFWFFLNLVIESSFIPLELIFEHRLYLPSIGIFLAVLSVLDHFCAKYIATSHPEIKKIVFLLLTIILSISSILTSIRNDDWRDRLSIYQDSMAKSPQKARAVSNYAMALGKAGQYDECAYYGMKVQSLGVEGYEDYMNSAANTLTCLLLQEKYKEAIAAGEEIRERILRGELSYIEAGAMHKYLLNLARAYTEEKEYRKAYETFQLSLFRAPHQAATFKSINMMFLMAQQDEQGRTDLKLSGDPLEIPVLLAQLAFKFREYGFAAQYLEEAAAIGISSDVLGPIEEKLANALRQNSLVARESSVQNNSTFRNNPQFRLYMKTADFILRKYRPLKGMLTGWLLSRAQKIDPDNPFVSVYRARWLMANDQIDTARFELEELVANNKNFVPVLELLGQIYRNNGNYMKAVPILKHVLEINHGHRNWDDYWSYVLRNEDKLEKE